MIFDKHHLCLYAITDRTRLGKRTLVQAVTEAIQGGATMVQLREKQLSDERFLAEAHELSGVCRQFGVPFIINDRIDIALACDADGVHLGQGDTNVAVAKATLGANKIIGISAKTVEQACEAEQMGASYLGVGAMFPTTTKKDTAQVSLTTLTAICAQVSIPVCAIGGIQENNVMHLRNTGIAGIAVVSAIFAAPDMAQASRRLRTLVAGLIDGKIQ